MADIDIRTDFVLEADADPKGADWPKRSWDLPPPSSRRFRALRRMGPIRPAWPELKDGESVKAPTP